MTEISGRLSSAEEGVQVALAMTLAGRGVRGPTSIGWVLGRSPGNAAVMFARTPWIIPVPSGSDQHGNRAKPAQRDTNQHR